MIHVQGRIKNILFDLDGTLTDPVVGITSCIQHALKTLSDANPPHGSREIPSSHELKWCIGPPLIDSFAQLLPESDHAIHQLAIDFYRERFAEIGMFENELYPSIHEVLSELAKTHRLFLATSKPAYFAQQILKHFDLLKYFTRVYGAELDGRWNDKGELIEGIIIHEKLDATECMMVGDRKHDVIGAQKNRMSCVGVEWGYGSREELLTAGAIALADSPKHLLQLLNPKPIA